MNFCKLLLGFLILVSCNSKSNQISSDWKTIQNNFHAVPDSISLSVYWYWLSDNISFDGIEKDLLAMKEAGIGRAFIGNIGLQNDSYMPTPPGDVVMFTKQWFEIIRHAIKTASKLDIELGIFNSPGWSQSGGPWIKPSQSMRYLDYIQKEVNGGAIFSVDQSEFPQDFQPVAVVAYKNNNLISSTLKPLKTNYRLEGKDVGFLTQKNNQKLLNVPMIRGEAKALDVIFEEPFTANSIIIQLDQSPFKGEMVVEYERDGTYQLLKRIFLDRSNPNLHVGFRPYAEIVESLPETKSSKFRIYFFKETGELVLKKFLITSDVLLERYQEKQLAKMFQTPLPLWEEYQWETQGFNSENLSFINSKEVLEVSKDPKQIKSLTWEVPPGSWTVIVTGMRPTGVTNSPASPHATGLEMDKINSSYTQHHFDSYLGKIKEGLTAEELKSLKYVVADSYETGSQNWTDDFIEIFEQRYGYSPVKFLPIFTGTIVDNPEISNRFLWDLRRLVADRVSYEYVGGLKKVSNQSGMKLWLENYGHWGFPGEFLQYGGQADEIGGEFWNEGTLGDIENRAASSSARIYGKNKVASESFTAGGKAFERYPALLKKRADWSFTEGINHTLLHVMVHQPYPEKIPGINAWFGTEFNRHNSWFKHMDLFSTYLRRCNYMLQLGRPTANVLYFIGEDVPKMTGVQYPQLPKGYSFDYINAEVILQRLAVKNGKWVLPGGLEYNLLVLPKLNFMRPELIEKLQSLLNEGGVILGEFPERSPSLEGFPHADSKVNKISKELMGALNQQESGVNSIGKGKIFKNLSIGEIFKKLQVLPDFEYSEESLNILFEHRKLDDGDIYFISNQDSTTIEFQSAFNSSLKTAELWDPITGNIRKISSITTFDQRKLVNIKLYPHQSMFVVFKNVPSISSTDANFENMVEEQLADLNTSWKVDFSNQLLGEKFELENFALHDLKDNDIKAIKSFSGIVTYSRTFQWDPSKSPSSIKEVLLDLGDLSATAKIWINEKYAGGLWTPPYKVEIVEMLISGTNTVRVEVATTWVNRMIFESGLPENERKTWLSVNTFTPNQPIQKSGLIGPVKLIVTKTL